MYPLYFKLITKKKMKIPENLYKITSDKIKEIQKTLNENFSSILNVKVEWSFTEDIEKFGGRGFYFCLPVKGKNAEYDVRFFINYYQFYYDIFVK